VVKYSKENLFTDDTLLYLEGNDFETMCIEFNEDLQSILKFCEGNKLKTHPDKFQCLLVTTSS
jgi:hypothetical protein